MPRKIVVMADVDKVTLKIRTIGFQGYGAC
jgi:hypothetical protein